MAVEIAVSVYANSDDAFVAWAPSDFIPDCRGFRLERCRRDGTKVTVDLVENRLGFEKDKPRSGDHRPSDVWPFQRFNWTDHATDVGSEVRYRLTAMIANGNKAFKEGPESDWTPWITLTADAGDGFSCYFNRGLVLSQFVARYLRDNQLTPAKLKTQLKKSVGPFRKFRQGDLGLRLFELLADGKTSGVDMRAALYELDDDAIERAMVDIGSAFHLVLANGSTKAKDENAAARKRLHDSGIETVDRLLKNKGLGHNKFIVGATAKSDPLVWTGSTNTTTTGLCTQINNGLIIADKKVSDLYRKQWQRLSDASPPTTDPATFTDDLKAANDKATSLRVGAARVTIWFTPTSDGRDMQALSDLIAGAKSSILFLMFTPGPTGLHTLAAQRANEKDMYVKGVVSTLGQTKADNEKNVLDISLVSSDQVFKPDNYTVVQPQGEGGDIGPWIGEVTRSDFLSQVGHAIVHSKILLTFLTIRPSSRGATTSLARPVRRMTRTSSSSAATGA